LSSGASTAAAGLGRLVGDSTDRPIVLHRERLTLALMPGAPDGRASPVAVVTGGSSGIGKATVLALARAGFDVGFTYRSRANAARSTAEEARAAGRRAAVRRLDLSDAEAGSFAVQELIDELGGVDLLVNNAAINPRRWLLDESAEGWRRTLEVNLTGPMLCAQTAARSMVARDAQGRIVNVTSVLQEVPLPGGAAYCTAKAGLGMLTRVMALELAEHGILVNAVAPGHTATPMNYGDEEVDVGSTSWPQIPVGRSADPSEIAAVVAFLASSGASYATGATLLVDGGLLLVSGPAVLQQATGLPPSSGQPPTRR